MWTERLLPLIVVCGPTGAGKSALSLAIAERFSGEVVNCDSVQIFRGFDIGSAKLSAAEQRGIPHHLLDAAAPTDLFTAGDYARLGRAALAEINARGHLPVVAGGTGFYLRALLEGLFAGPPRDESIRARLQAREARRPGSLHRLLSRWDAAAALRIHRNDINKLIRALEVILTARQPLTGLFAQGRDPLTGYRTLTLGLNPPRAELYARLDARSQQMFGSTPAIVDEVRALLAAGVPRDAKPLASLGYAQAIAHIDGRLSLTQAIAETQMHTRRYAKRQWTWFRRDASTVWLPGLGSEPGVQHTAFERVADFLSAG
ncbi:MAG: tRNA (adenosine(37)-N6)-dimethylallyltransferase MiaA [Acidobacteria bacterium]|nr:tRNA (adenosine(37)-N6)-dimethylallyltransferase MiaA [Acidobacteriota bacterium]